MIIHFSWNFLYIVCLSLFVAVLVGCTSSNEPAIATPSVLKAETSPTILSVVEQPTPTIVPTVASLDENPLTSADTVSPTPAPQSNAVPPTRIVAETIDLDTDVVPVGWRQVDVEGQQVSQWNVADYAAGWHLNSAMPGQTGNIVLTGHHNIRGEVFRYIVDLKEGDQITLYTDHQPFIYEVTDKLILKDSGESEETRITNARWIETFDDERLTLVTCWPYNNNTHRLIVVAKPLPLAAHKD